MPAAATTAVSTAVLKAWNQSPPQKSARSSSRTVRPRGLIAAPAVVSLERIEHWGVPPRIQRPHLGGHRRDAIGATRTRSGSAGSVGGNSGCTLSCALMADGQSHTTKVSAHSESNTNSLSPLPRPHSDASCGQASGQAACWMWPSRLLDACWLLLYGPPPTARGARYGPRAQAA